MSAPPTSSWLDQPTAASAWDWRSTASQGAGRLLRPLVAGVVRLVIAAGGGWVASRWFGGGLSAVFTAIAVAFVLYAAIVAAAIRAGTPGTRRRVNPWHGTSHIPL